MAKKGGVQQLQADINTDDEFEKFLDRKGLLVCDVYTEWCGPCLAMVGSLKKIKLELGGDNLQLAICKSDTIESLKRFRGKSEPTWLFASHGKSVNIMFGTNVPKLMQIIANELEIELASADGQAQRLFFNISDLLPIEVERLNIVLGYENEAKRIEEEAAAKKRSDYLTFVTDEIIANMPDFGVTIFGPHVNRDIYKKLTDAGDVLGLQCRDRKVGQIVPSNLEVLHFQCENPLDPEILNYIFNKDVLMCLWKIENMEQQIENVLNSFVESITQPLPVLDDLGNETPDVTIPPLLTSYELVAVREVSKQEVEKKEESKAEEHPSDDMTPEGIALAMASSLEQTPEESTEEQPKSAEEAKKEEEEPKKSEPIEISSVLPTKVIIPPVWTPIDKVTNAAAIYLYFRTQTDAFLPPDPIPDPPHLAIAFEAYKRKDILELCEQYKTDILSYGYFDSANSKKAQLIANSTSKYETKHPSINDKLVLKVAKVTSHAILALSAQGPAYVSQNTVEGQKECLKFFPEGYQTGETEEQQSTSQVDASGKKKKKKKKKTEGGESAESGMVTDVSDPDAAKIESIPEAEAEGEAEGEGEGEGEFEGEGEGEVNAAESEAGECPLKDGGLEAPIELSAATE